MSLPALLAPVNRMLTPLIRQGVGSPLLLSYGLIVAEIPGRKTGRLYTVPLVAWFAPGRLIVGTVRGNSQWVRNLAAVDVINVWLWGQQRPVAPTVFTSADDLRDTSADVLTQGIAALSAPPGVTVAELRLCTP